MTPSTLWKYAGCMMQSAGAVISLLFLSATLADAQIVSPSFDRPVEKTVQPVPVPAGAGIEAPAGAPLQMNPAVGQTRQDLIIDNATSVIEEFVSMRLRKIPTKVFREAQAIAIIPNVIKGGFIVGIRHGMGVLLPKAPNGGFAPPRFVSLTGGSVGFQAGVQSTDVVLVFRTKQSVQNLMHGTFTLGADAAAAAGPFGRQASAATTAQLNAEVWSYSKSRGAFVGVSLDGSALQIDRYADQMYYHTATGLPGASWPTSAYRLVTVLDSYLGISPHHHPGDRPVCPRLWNRPPRYRAFHLRRPFVVNSLLQRRTCMRPFPTKNGGNFWPFPNRCTMKISRSIQQNYRPPSHILIPLPVHRSIICWRANRYFRRFTVCLKRYTASTTASGLSLPPPPPPAPAAASVPTQPRAVAETSIAFSRAFVVEDRLREILRRRTRVSPSDRLQPHAPQALILQQPNKAGRP